MTSCKDDEFHFENPLDSRISPRCGTSASDTDFRGALDIVIAQIEGKSMAWMEHRCLINWERTKLVLMADPESHWAVDPPCLPDEDKLGVIIRVLTIGGETRVSPVSYEFHPLHLPIGVSIRDPFPIILTK